MAFLTLVTAAAAVVATTQPANAQVYNTCRPDLWTGKCASGYTPANHTLDRVWIGIDTGSSIANWEVWDRETGARVGSGKVSPNTNFRHGIYGLYGNKYQLTINGAWGIYGFICDC
ncbi:hypothetical protein [Sphaerisporangium flaviroseum]